ncbi:MAG: hypothetical protein U9R79_13170 [Armatimonadota bacterium]|nr:hypothetical protein [Armatimonadota bacterium]
MQKRSFFTELGERLSDPSSRSLRRVLTGFWVLSILLGVGAAVLVITSRRLALGQIDEHEPLAGYALPAGLSFASQYVDATLGMGYGTTLTALLLMLGFPVTQVVLAVLLQQLIAGGIASITHHALGNADLRPGSFHFRLAMLLGGLAVVGSFMAATVARWTDLISVNGCECRLRHRVAAAGDGQRAHDHAVAVGLGLQRRPLMPLGIAQPDADGALRSSHRTRFRACTGSGPRRRPGP